MAPPPAFSSILILVLLVGPLVAGCFGDPEEPRAVSSPGWVVGDRWVYQRTTGEVSALYVREVTGLFEKRGQEVFEVTEGLQGHSIRRYNLYTVDSLRYMGTEVRDGHDLRTKTDPVDPLTFHYAFPLAAGRTVQESGRIHQTAGSVSQIDDVEIEAHVEAPRSLVMGERVYEVWPYEIRVRYTTTPFEDVVIVQGHWSPGVGQSVLTTVEEGGTKRTYELLSFTRAQPLNGDPVYRLTDRVSNPLTHGFHGATDGPGYSRYLFHVREPTRIEMTFSLPAATGTEGLERIDLVALRPVGYGRAGVAWNTSSIAEPGVVMHLAASHQGGKSVVFHTPDDQALQRIELMPGQIYELLLASNIGPVEARIIHGSGFVHQEPQETGKVDVLAVSHRSVSETYGPGPQNVRDSVRAIVAVPDGARVEGLVYAVNLGGSDQAIGEVRPMRQVSYHVDGLSVDDSDALYGFYLGHVPRGRFTVEAGFAYQADMAVRGAVQYEVGALLMRLEPPAS